MKKETIKINESQLRQIVKESVENILKEGYVWHGNVQPLKTIMDACYEICESYKNYDWDNVADDGYANIDLYNFAKQTYETAQNFIEHNSDNVSIDA